MNASLILPIPCRVPLQSCGIRLNFALAYIATSGELSYEFFTLHASKSRFFLLSHATKRSARVLGANQKKKPGRLVDDIGGAHADV